MADILHELTIAAPPARVFARLATGEGVASWWTADADMQSGIGGALTLGFGGGRTKRLQVETLAPGQRVEWRVLACFLSEWVSTVIGFELESVGDGVRLRFAHRGFADGCGCLAMCTTGWGFYLERLKRVCEADLTGPVVVHSIPGSPFGRAVLAVLEEKRAPYRLAPVAPGTFRSAAHLARHPFGKVPVIEHGGFRLYETQAILRHLDRALPDPPLTPAHPRDAARMDQLLNLNDWYLFKEAAAVIGFHRIVGPRLMGLTPDEAAVAEAVPKGRTALAEMERLMGEGPYLVGDRPSLVDFLVTAHLDFLAQTPEWALLTADAPRLTEYRERMEARPSMQATTWPRVAEMANVA